MFKPNIDHEFKPNIDLVLFCFVLPQGLHFLEKFRFESTIGQQMKLIDYLQELWKDSVEHKKKKVGEVVLSLQCYMF